MNPARVQQVFCGHSATYLFGQRPRVRVPTAWKRVRSDKRRDDQSEVPCRLEGASHGAQHQRQLELHREVGDLKRILPTTGTASSPCRFLACLACTRWAKSRRGSGGVSSRRVKQEFGQRKEELPRSHCSRTTALVTSSIGFGENQPQCCNDFPRENAGKSSRPLPCGRKNVLQELVSRNSMLGDLLPLGSCLSSASANSDTSTFQWEVQMGGSTPRCYPASITVKRSQRYCMLCTWSAVQRVADLHLGQEMWDDTKNPTVVF